MPSESIHCTDRQGPVEANHYSNTYSKMKMKLLSFQFLLVAVEIHPAAVGAFTPGRPQNYDGRSHYLDPLAASKGDEQIEKFQVASSRGSDAVETKKIRSGKPSGWDSIKGAIYGTVDGVGSLSKKLAAGSGDSGVESGYSSIERNVLNEKGNSSPGQRLMNEYRARSTPAPTTPTKSESSQSTFDAIKETVYGGMDVASQVFSNEKVGNDESLRSFKPLAQSTLSSSSEVRGALPDLQSSNPITRKIAEAKIKNWEEKDRKRQRALEREEAARKFKETVYQLGDVVVASAESLASVPDQVTKVADETTVIAKKVKKTADEIPVKVDKVVNTVTSIPDQVQDSVKTTVESTKQVIDDVRAIPTKVENSVKETQQKVKDTQQKVKETQEKVNDAVTSVKVLFGLEKPVPKPPKTAPPPQPTLGDLGKRLAGDTVKGVVTGTAKVAWWAGKGVATTAWNEVQSAVEKSRGEAAPAKTNEVDEEVQEALKLAQSALEFADQGKKEEGENSRKNK